MSTRLAVTAVPLPRESRVASIYAAPNLADAYSIELPDGASGDPEVLARFIFSEIPPWMIALLQIRDALVAGFGLKTARQLQSIGIENMKDRIGIFKVYSRERNEVVLGEDDTHLDFRLSVLWSDSLSLPNKRRLILSTVVHCHNRLGRIYIFLIAPFHRLIVRSSLAHAGRVGWPGSSAHGPDRVRA